ncbi:MAG TPA: 2-oxo-4-hydroxy-4-carboxy-5-ureidoimidazoline decarboxylase [Burkholderiaceae bacterium]|nr:2-oxo-4-hydroxy-4-carboxy-5-ureidoimidazoline decarboxylase [Burkholderiaceae bacterium]
MTPTRASALTLNDLSALSRSDFATRLEGIFEHSPWIPERAWDARPFGSVDALHRAMIDVVDMATDEERLALISAHPELAGREAARGTLTQASAQEQKGAGLDQCSADELQRLCALNAAYRARFGFPFIIAVKGLSRHDIMDALEQRLHNAPAMERDTCLREIAKIARIRLDALLDGPGA